MKKRVILITGTPCVGKTTTAKALASRLGAEYINLTDYAKANNLTVGIDEERSTLIIDEKKMQRKLSETVDASNNPDVIIDGHYASVVAPAEHVGHVFVLRRNPKELKVFMEKCGFEGAKLWENLSAEILDVCLVEALQTQPGKVCELDVTGKTVDEVVDEIVDVLEGSKKCFSGGVDWLGKLEREGLTDQYLKE